MRAQHGWVTVMYVAESDEFWLFCAPNVYSKRPKARLSCGSVVFLSEDWSGRGGPQLGSGRSAPLLHVSNDIHPGPQRSQ